MRDERGTLGGFDNTAAKLRYCRWGESDVTLAESSALEANATAEISCSAANIEARVSDFAGAPLGTIYKYLYYLYIDTSYPFVL